MLPAEADNLSSNPNDPQSDVPPEPHPEGNAATGPGDPTDHPDPNDLPLLPDSIFPTLPGILQKVVAVAGSKAERDVMLLGALGVFSACLPKLHGYYDGKKVCPHLYLFVTAQASAGKGRLSFCKQLVMPIDEILRKEAKRLKERYDLDMKKYNKLRGKRDAIKKPVRPPELMLIIPTNNSATGVFQIMSENEGRGLLFETEGDTLSQAFKADHGNYSDGMRKGAHHEAISYYRRTEHEFVLILFPCLAAVLSGTPRQVATLIRSIENGLFSRFIFYHMTLRRVWKDVFAANGHKNLEAYFDQLGQEFLPLYKALNAKPEIEFSLSAPQQLQFNAFFTRMQDEYVDLQGINYIGTIRRLGLIAYRLAMTLTGLRILESDDFSPQQVCSEVDFQTALSMVSVLVRHSSYIYSELQQESQTARVESKSDRLIENLPLSFNHKDLMEVATKLSIPKRTADLYLASFCNLGLVVREKRGTYTNLTISEDTDKKKKE